jgi:beta-phosphoglucomutase-like phosphatase (HAD superfamily)
MTERLLFRFTFPVNATSFISSPKNSFSITQDLHLLKTDNFNKVVEGGGVKLRPGVMRLIDEAFAAGLFVAVCSTSNDAAVRTIVRTLLGTFSSDYHQSKTLHYR